MPTSALTVLHLDVSEPELVGTASVQASPDLALDLGSDPLYLTWGKHDVLEMRLVGTAALVCILFDLTTDELRSGTILYGESESAPRHYIGDDTDVIYTLGRSNDRVFIFGVHAGRSLLRAAFDAPMLSLTADSLAMFHASLFSVSALAVDSLSPPS